MGKIQLQIAKMKNFLGETLFRILLFVILGLILFVSMYSNVKPEKLDLTLFSVADQTIRSPITVEDKESTERKRKEALNNVQDVYILKKEYTQNRVDLITSIFDSVSEVKEDIADEMAKAENTDKAEPPVSVQLEKVKQKLTDNETKELSDSVFIALLQSSNDELSIARDLTVTAINYVMSSRIPQDDVENAKKRLEEELKYTSLNSNLKNAAIELGRYAVIQNEFYDPNATEEMRQQAMEGVEPVLILEGQILVEEGQLISRDIYRQLELAGISDNEHSFKPFVGLALLILILLGGLYFFFHYLGVSQDIKHKYVLIVSIILVMSIAIMKVLSLFLKLNYSEIAYIFPAAMGAMLIKLLTHERLAVAFSLILAICGGIIFNEGITATVQVTVMIYILISGMASVLFLSNHNNRSKILQAGLLVAAVNMVVIFSLLFLRNGQFSGMEYGFYLIGALLSGIGSAVLTIGLIPYFEAGFGILSTLKLIELSNPNHPLLKKILTEAPGTYHHSVMVANLAETACEAIGANGLLARVGCYYHDIGKTKRPQFFIENQMNIQNPHDRLPPQTSKNIIIAHAIDGVEMLKRHKMPREIIDIAEQHHGTTLLQYFYHKAKKDGIEVKEMDYRYPGPKAQTKEAAIIGIADSVEAAVRSMGHPTHEQIESVVRKIIADRLADDQFNECDLTLKELETVSNALLETLKGIFHSRIEYPETIKQKVSQA
ncbi:HD family phosphohydrolase [Bacillus sp. DNRA2]|uniref:HD family phosphohydrolase n=1 Tax=Bacillus sp. DNRA2 TaxID=2723053 RepID=UPI00145F5712|nr:HD family phosphohydrolase [Bacillus sp. DNRA2]NMD70662.1 HD family phosphohydrolase [Bacillus sp. DNRA2]